MKLTRIFGLIAIPVTLVVGGKALFDYSQERTARKEAEQEREAMEQITTPFPQYMDDRGYPGLSRHFEQKNLRVVHADIHSMAESDSTGQDTSIRLRAQSQRMLFQGQTLGLIVPPPEDLTAQQLWADFMGADLGPFKYAAPDEDVRRLLFEHIMLHEARHCDQSFDVLTSAQEADADQYGFEVLQKINVPTALLHQYKEDFTNARVISALVYKDTLHNTAPYLRNFIEPQAMSEENAGLWELREKLQVKLGEDTAARVCEVMPASYLSALYNAAKDLCAEGHLSPAADRAARAFVESCEYFNGRARTAWLNAPFAPDAARTAPADTNLSQPAAADSLRAARPSAKTAVKTR